MTAAASSSITTPRRLSTFQERALKKFAARAALVRGDHGLDLSGALFATLILFQARNREL